MMKICKYCGKEYNASTKTSKYCSYECSVKNRKSNKITVYCKHCKKELKRYPSQCLSDIFCSKKCLSEYIKINNSVVFNCEICGKEKRIPKSDYDKSKHHYCSYECSRIGFSKNYNGENSSNYECFKCKCDYCNKEFVTKKSYMKDHNNHFCSRACKDKWQGENIRGENHYNYNPNIPLDERVTRRGYTEYWDWRNNVYKRDNYSCQCCGDDRGGNLNAHHIFNYAEHESLRTYINNGITLCDICHKLFHNKYGNKNNNKSQLEEFLKENSLI